MRITPVKNPIVFTYKSVIKTEWLKGNMPSVKHDIGGNLLTKENITNGHMLPVSKGGKTNLKNLTLETLSYNQMKGNKPFSWFFDIKNFMRYCDEMAKVDLPNFKGIDYVRGIIETAFELIKGKK